MLRKKQNILNYASYCHFLILSLVITAIAIPSIATANEKTEYLATGGIGTIDNEDIEIYSLDLDISEQNIKADYILRNNSSKDIVETLSLTMPPLAWPIDGHYSDAGRVLETLRITSEGSLIDLELEVRSFMPAKTLYRGEVDYGYVDYDQYTMIETTQLFKDCGVIQNEMMGFWKPQDNLYAVQEKLAICDHKMLDKLHKAKKLATEQGEFLNNYVYWTSQPIYRWKEKIKAKNINTIRHSYTPMVGGSDGLDEDFDQLFCANKDLSKALLYGYPSYAALDYKMLGNTGSARSIPNFSLTIQGKANERVSFCWSDKDKVREIEPNTFQIKQKNFIPTQDLHIAFIQR